VSLEIIGRAIIGLLLGYFMWKLKQIEEKANSAMNSDDVRQLIEDRKEPLEVRLAEIKEDTKRMESKIDKLIDRLSQTK